jgi:hypothetical protein
MPAPPGVLTADQRNQLNRLTRDRSVNIVLGLRARHWLFALVESGDGEASKTARTDRGVACICSRPMARTCLKPHRQDTFKLSRDLHVAEKVADIVGLYLAPLAAAVVLSVDEQSGVQALDRTSRCFP